MSDAELRAAIIQEESTGRVLMLGWMDDEAIALTQSSGEVHFYSRSRQRLWKKGESSGNVLHVNEIEPDCDGDALLITVHAAGPTCHDGSTSCFTPWLWRRILQRDAANDIDSYVVRQLRAGVSTNAQKVGEEATEVVVAAMGESDERVLSEAADLWFHLLLLLRARGLDPSGIDDELRRRVRD